MVRQLPFGGSHEPFRVRVCRRTPRLRDFFRAVIRSGQTSRTARQSRRPDDARARSAREVGARR